MTPSNQSGEWKSKLDLYTHKQARWVSRALVGDDVVKQDMTKWIRV